MRRARKWLRNRAKQPRTSFFRRYLYFVVPRVILFRLEHTPRTLVKEVDFISAPGFSDDDVYRPGGPYKLITDRCLFHVNKQKKCFELESVHPGHTVNEILEQTGFEFLLPDNEVPETETPDEATLKVIRGEVAREISEIYPSFASRVFGIK